MWLITILGWHCCILTSEIKGITVPISAIWQRSNSEPCQYLDTGTGQTVNRASIWILAQCEPEAHPPPKSEKGHFYSIKQLDTLVVSLQYSWLPVSIYGCNKSVVTHSTRAHMAYIGSVVTLPSGPGGPRATSLLSQYMPCGTRACVTTITKASTYFGLDCRTLFVLQIFFVW